MWERRGNSLQYVPFHELRYRANPWIMMQIDTFVEMLMLERRISQPTVDMWWFVVFIAAGVDESLMFVSLIYCVTQIWTMILPSCSDIKRRTRRISIKISVLKGIYIAARLSTLLKEYQVKTMMMQNISRQYYIISGVVCIAR